MKKPLSRLLGSVGMEERRLRPQGSGTRPREAVRASLGGADRRETRPAALPLDLGAETLPPEYYLG